MIYPLIIFALSLWGFFLCKKIWKKKKQQAPLTCPLGADCDTVIKSEFSKFFGIGLEIHGMAYYLLIGLAYLATFLYKDLYSVPVIFVLFGISMAAFFFSLYLTFVQAFYIKSWCTWCLTSAGITTFIFGISTYGVISNGVNFVPLLILLAPFILALQLIGFALGVGGSTINDVLFIKFLKDFKISKEENEILKTMSQIIWVGILFVVISEIGLYLPNMETLNASPHFLVKIFAIFTIILNGAFLNLIISPKLTKMSLKDSGVDVTKADDFRKTAFVSGAVSFVSWYTTFILAIFKEIPLSLNQLLLIYVLLLLIGVIVGLIFEKIYCASAYKQKTY